MSLELLQKINYDKAYRKNRLEAANWVLENLHTLPDLLNYCFNEDIKLATKASWVLDFVYRQNLQYLYPHLDYIFNNIINLKSDGQLRSFGLLYEMLTINYYKKKDPYLLKLLTPRHKEVMIESSFDWMITNQKVACQARAMTALYFLGTEYDWIHPELAIIIQQNLATASAGYKHRGKNTLVKIKEFNQAKSL